jgi:hypothetical protein
MDKRYRVRIVIGVWLMIGGLLVAYLAPIVPIVAPELGSSDMAGSAERLSALRRSAMVGSMAGFGLSLLSGLYAMTQWSRWFIRSARAD